MIRNAATFEQRHDDWRCGSVADEFALRNEVTGSFACVADVLQVIRNALCLGPHGFRQLLRMLRQNFGVSRGENPETSLRTGGPAPWETPLYPPSRNTTGWRWVEKVGFSMPLLPVLSVGGLHYKFHLRVLE